jgi:tetratricopeptide (TPR) repeat protein
MGSYVAMSSGRRRDDLEKLKAERTKDFARWYFERARLSQKEGNLDEAIREYYESLGVLEGDPEVRYNLGLALIEKGDTDQAQKELRKAATDAGPGTQIATLAEKALGDLKK